MHGFLIYLRIGIGVQLAFFELLEAMGADIFPFKAYDIFGTVAE